MSFTADLSGLAQVRRNLREFGQAIKAEVAMDGAAAGAKVLYDRARMLAPVSEKEHVFYGRNSKRTGVTYTFAPGNLRAAIYRAFAEEQSSETRKQYRISWNHYKAPYGHMVEFGTVHVPAHSFLGAALSAMPEALTAAKSKMAQTLAFVQGRQ